MDSKKNDNNIFHWIKKHKLLTVCLGIIIYIVIPILPFIQSPIGIFSKEDATLFLSYYGTIVSGLIGGALTLSGVWWTIKKQEEQRKKDLAIQYRPYLKIEKKDIQFNAITEKQPIYEPDENNEPIFIKDEIVDMSKFNVNISLKNIGRGEITKINISCTYRDDHISSNFKRKILDIMPEDSFNLLFDISLCDYEKFIYVDYDSTVNIQIDYFDFLNNKYHVEIPIYITNYPPNPQYDEINEIAYDDGNNTFFYNIGEIIRFEMNK